MPATPRRALLVIDVQNEYFTGAIPIEFPPTASSLPNILLAVDAAQSAGIPVIVVQHDGPEGSPIFAKGSGGWRLHPAIAALRADHHIHKTSASAFAGTDLSDFLAARAIDTLVLAGYMTHNCDAATLYQARSLDLNVEFLSDASGALSYENAAGRASAEDIHRVFGTVFHSSFAAVTTTGDWIAAVQSGQAIARDNIYLSNQRARQSAATSTTQLPASARYTPGAPQERATAYATLAQQARALLAGEHDLIANAANFSALVYDSLPGLNWAGFYFLHDAELVLGPFKGKPACVRIALDRGVCGKAASTREIQVVPDVHAFPGHIACDPASRSEIVVPLVRADGALLGVWDVDSPHPGRFDQVDAEGMQALARVFLDQLARPAP